MPKRYKINQVSKRRSYSVKDISCLFDVDKRTCFRWLEEGLQPLEEKAKPLLIMGDELISFLKEKSGRGKVKLKKDEYYCLRCRVAVKATGGSEQIIETGKLLGKDNRRQYRKIGRCEACGSIINRFSK